MNRERLRYRIGEYAASYFAGEIAGSWIHDDAATDHYEPAERHVCLTRKTYWGRDITAVMCGVHEAMHARQHAENSLTWRLYRAGRWVWVPWCGCAGLAVWRFWDGDWLRGVTFVLLALFCGVLRAFTILNLETDAWARTRKWVMDNFITGPDDWAAMDRVAKAGVGSYVKGIFGL